MTIQIDDSGWGCPLGGVLIAAYRVETREFRAHEIPVSEFQGAVFESRHYLRTAWLCAQKALLELGRAKGEPVQVCQGWVNQDIRAALGVPGSKITGIFQARIEEELLAYLHNLGFPYQGSTEEYGKLFFEAIRWLKGGNPQRRGMDPDRVKLAKTGWATFPIYEKHPYTVATKLAREFKRRQRGGWRGRGGDDWG